MMAMPGLRSVTVSDNGDRNSPGSECRHPRLPKGHQNLLHDNGGTGCEEAQYHLAVALLDWGCRTLSARSPNVCSLGQLKTATILRRPISSGKLARRAHRAFAVAVGGWRVGSVARPTAGCTAGSAHGPFGRIERTGPTWWSPHAPCRSWRRVETRTRSSSWDIGLPSAGTSAAGT